MRLTIEKSKYTSIPMKYSLKKITHSRKKLKYANIRQKYLFKDFLHNIKNSTTIIIDITALKAPKFFNTARPLKKLKYNFKRKRKNNLISLDFHYQFYVSHTNFVVENS